jgi:glyoxylase-like metal-dependent hydrolase (beta-lactamase superfamily II)
MAAFNQTVPPSPAAALPVLTFPTRATFHWNGNIVNVYHIPNAHTDGDSIIHFTNLNVFHMGDTFVNGGYPFIDNGSNGSINGLIAAAESVLARSDANTKIIPGHGPLATPDDLRAYLNVVKTTRDRVQALISQGRTEQQVVDAKPTAEWDATYGAGFMNGETFTRFTFQDLSER